MKRLPIAVVVPVGPGREMVLDTLESVEIFAPEAEVVFVLDDHTTDGTYDSIVDCRSPRWRVLRNSRVHGIDRLVHTLCKGFHSVLRETQCELVLRLDQDALLIKPGILEEAFAFMSAHQSVGIFGVYEVDHNRPRCFEVHRDLMRRETGFIRRITRGLPSWAGLLSRARENGYRDGDNVFGGAYFITRACLEAMRDLGALDVPWDWRSRLQEDVYFSMASAAAGCSFGHFAAPVGPLCMEWRGLPMPARSLAASPFKLVHSVDKGPNTGPVDNLGQSARQVFRQLREPFAASKSPPF